MFAKNKNKGNIIRCQLEDDECNLSTNVNNNVVWASSHLIETHSSTDELSIGSEHDDIFHVSHFNSDKDYFLLSTDGILRHWRYKNNKWYFICVITHNSDLPYYLADISPFFFNELMCYAQTCGRPSDYMEIPNCITNEIYLYNFESYIYHVGVYEYFPLHFHSGDGLDKINTRRRKRKKHTKGRKPWRAGKYTNFSNRILPCSFYNILTRDYVNDTSDVLLNDIIRNIPLEIYEAGFEEGFEGTEVIKHIKEIWKNSVTPKLECHAGLDSFIPSSEDLNDGDKLFKSLFESSKMFKSTYPTCDEFISSIEEVISLAVVLYDAVTWRSMFASVYLYISGKLMRKNKSLCKTVLDYVCDLLSGEPELEVQSNFSDVRNGVRRMFSHPATRHISTLISLCVSLEFLRPSTFSLGKFKMFTIESLKNTNSCTDVFDVVVTSFGFFFDHAWKYFKSGSTAEFFTAQDEVSQFVHDTNYLVQHIPEIKQGNYTDLTGKDEIHFSNLLDSAILTSQVITTNFGFPAPLLTTMKKQLASVRIDYTKYRRMSSMRSAPFAICLYGKTCVGKTTCLKYLTKSILLANAFPAEDEHYVYLNANDEFQPTMKSNLSCIVIDDMANAKMETMHINDSKVIIDLINNSFTYANMPEAGDKGSVSVNPKLVAVTTNVKHLDAYKKSNEPASILRRFNYYITLSVKPEFTKTDMQSLDSDKVGEKFTCDDDIIEDIWLLTIETVVVRNSSIKGASDVHDFVAVTHNGKKMINVGIIEALQFLNGQSLRHFVNQKDIVKKGSRIESRISRCDICGNFKQTCICKPILENQAGIDLVDVLTAGSSLAKSVANGENIYYALVSQTANWTYNAIADTGKKIFNDISHTLCPTLFERTLYRSNKYIDRVLSYRNMFNVKYSIFYGYVPHWILCTDLFEKTYMFAERKGMIKLYSFLMVPVTLGIACNVGCVLFSDSKYKPRHVGVNLTGWYILSASAYRYSHNKYLTYLHNTRDNLKIINEQRTTRELKDSLLDPELHAGYSKLKHGIFKATVAAAIVAGGFTIVSILKQVISIWHRQYTDSQALLSSEDGSHVEARDTRRDIWLNNSVVKYPGTTMTSDQFTDIVSKGTRYMRVKETGAYCNAIMMETNFFIIPYHVFFKGSAFESDQLDTIHLEMVIAPLYKNGKQCTGTVNNKLTANSSNSYRIPGTDLVLVTANTGVLPKLSDYLTNVPYNGQYTSIWRDKVGEIVRGHGVCSRSHIERHYGKVSLDYVALETKHNVAWIKGDCMSVIVTKTSDPKIAGFHLMGFSDSQSNIGYSCVLTAKLYEDAINHMKNKSQSIISFHSSTSISHTVCGIDIGYNQCLNDTPFNWTHKHVEWPIFDIIGHCDGGVSPTSNFRDSKISLDLVNKLGIKQLWGPPQFRPRDIKGRPMKFAPWETALMQLTNPCVMDDYNALSWAMEDYQSSLISLVGKYDKSCSRPLSNMEIINGIDGKRFIDKMKFTTSMGFPFKGTKEKYMHFVDSNCIKRDFISPLFFDDVARCERDYLKNLSCNHIFGTFLKDEALLKRGSDGSHKKVRLVLSCPIILQLLIRKYYLPILRFLAVNPLISECAVGINAYSPEWHEMFDYVCAHTSDSMVMAGDYSSWDQRLPNNVTACALKVLINIAISMGYDQSSIKIMEGISTDLANPLINFNGTLVRFCGYMPSGNNLTAVLNSIANSLVQRYVYYNLYKQIFSGNRIPIFRDNVHTMNYGDDMVCGVKKGVEIWYNHITYANYLSNKVGMKFTMPNKVDEPTALMPLSKTDFLKRISVTIEGCNYNGVPCYLGKLDIMSIYKSLMCVSCLKGNEDNVLVAVMASALHELFLHGRDEYDKHLSVFKEIFDKYKIICPQFDIGFDKRILKWNEDYIEEGKIHDNGFNPDCLGGISDLEYHSGTCEDSTLYIKTDYRFSREIGIFIDNGVIAQYKVDELVYTTYQVSICVGNVYTIINQSNTIIEYEQLITEVLCAPGDLTSNKDTLHFHSGMSNGEENAVVTTGLTTFDVDGGNTVETPSTRDETFNLCLTPDCSMQDFMKRPVLLRTFQWDIGAQQRFTLPLVAEFMQNKRVSNRLNNYAWFTGTMCVKIMINGTSFHYGKLVIAANHFPNVDRQTSQYVVPGISMTQLTQLPHIMCNPTEATGGCLEVPLYYPHNMIPFAETIIEDLVDLDIRTFNVLSTVNPSADMALTVQVWAWFKDITLAMPTAGNMPYLTTQSGMDEYDDKFSTNASLVAANIGKFSKAPIIGKYAKASEMAIGAIADAARAFGYSKPSYIQDAHTSIIHPAGNMSNTNSQDTCTKLALDAKNEVTVDQSVTGYSNEDCMDIRHIGARESWLTSYLWNPLLIGPQFTMNVTPIQYKIPVGVEDARIITPACHAALPFKYWRGTMKVRVEVIASAFHKGKLRIVYDPSTRMQPFSPAWADEYNLNYSYIIDISKEREYTFHVGWGSNRSYLLTDGLIGSNYAIWPNEPRDSISLGSFNGMLGIHSVVPLSSIGGTSTNPVFVNVYVSMSDDFEVAVPKCSNINPFTTGYGTNAELADLTFQSAIEEAPGGPMVDGGAMTHEVLINTNYSIDQSLSDKLALIHLGEKVTSVRQVVKRYCDAGYWPYQLLRDESDLQVGYNVLRFRFNNFPSYPGKSRVAEGYTLRDPDSGELFNFVGNCNWLTWFTPAYLMRRGSLRNKYITRHPVKGLDEAFNLLHTSATNSSSAGSQFYIATNVPFDDAVTLAKTLGRFETDCGFCGMLTNFNVVNNVIGIETPHQTDKRWFLAQHREVEAVYSEPTLRFSDGHEIRIDTYYSGTDSVNGLTRYTAAGDDYSLIYYKYAPILYTPST
uniref:Genome polyprotein n=1 Tax=Fish-associated picorna-like virus 3 TaxID=3003959 RepID=A0A9E9FYE8_9VIRU|nr:MAG: hypothetical protein [Fish-associated picorna-like virus 3]